MPNYHLAQTNIVRMLAPIDDPLMAEVVGLKLRKGDEFIEKGSGRQ